MAFITFLRRSFNSQRDGILLSFNLRLKFSQIVSIPNGMEFYTSVSLPHHRHKSVSIPNGMEFYMASWVVLQLESLVSIPNGMEFYEYFDSTTGLCVKFQFPTGWNSTLPNPQACKSYDVSIPNGMEFY